MDLALTYMQTNTQTYVSAQTQTHIIGIGRGKMWGLFLKGIDSKLLFFRSFFSNLMPMPMCRKVISVDVFRVSKIAENIVRLASVHSFLCQQMNEWNDEFT